MTHQREVVSRCRWLVENRATTRREGDLVVSEYQDQVVKVRWQRAAPEISYGTEGPMTCMTVSAHKTGLVIGSYSGQYGGSTLETKRAQEIVTHLRSIMVLDDFARAV